MIAKEPYTARWLEYLNAWDNSLYEKSSGASYKTNHVSNFIYSSIEGIRPVLFDNNPKFEAIPVTADGMPYSNEATAILDWEWHRTNMQELLLANSVYTFTVGTSIIMLPYTFKDGADGNVTPMKISPFNLFPNPLATSVEDAEYLIYADYFHVNKLKQMYPKKVDFLQGSDVIFSELVNDRDEGARLDDQVLVLEMWCRDYSIIDCEDEDGNKSKKMKYPNGRVVICAPDLGVVFEDKENPYDTGRFPFFLFKDIDVPFQFWGEGEVKWLLSPQSQINDLYNQIIDNAKHTANMQWVIDKNAGIPQGQLTNRPGLIIRKNPGSEVRRDSPPSMPMYVESMIEKLKDDMEVISGIHDVTRGETPSGIQSASAILALQEAAQIRIRLKVTLHENTLGVLGTEWWERIKQFWKFNRTVPRKVDETKYLSQQQLSGVEIESVSMFNDNKPMYEMLEVDEDKIKHDFVIKIIGSGVMQNSRASMLDQMIRLLQTPAEDGLPCVPREALLDYLPSVNKRLVLEYFDKIKQEQLQQQMQQGMQNDAMMMLQQLSQQVQELGNAVGSLQQKTAEEEKTKYEEELMNKGYEQGATEIMAMQTQMDKSGQLPPEILQELAQLSDEELALVLSQEPELVNMLGE